jgi:hypothetical protein
MRITFYYKKGFVFKWSGRLRNAHTASNHAVLVYVAPIFLDKKDLKRGAGKVVIVEAKTFYKISLQKTFPSLNFCP